MFGNHGDDGFIEINRRVVKVNGTVATDETSKITDDTCQPHGEHRGNDGEHLGFSHLFRTPNPTERYRGLGLSTKKEIRATQNLLLKLSQQISSNQTTPGSAGEWENGSIPAGYTYLFQLIGHDITHTARSLPVTDGGPHRPVNLRRTQLELETVYGGGPTVDTIGYEVPETGKGDRFRLKLGRMRLDGVRPVQCPFLDIPRISDALNSGNGATGAGDVLIADPRNDDNVILSQMTALFHHLHNAVVGRFPDANEPASNSGRVASNTFARARNVVVSTYRDIIRNDLLAKVLHPQVYAHYDALPAEDFAHSAEYAVPLEFAHAVSRVGHAMIRPQYAIRDTSQAPQNLGNVVRATSSRRPTTMPLPREWIVQWSLFFDLNKPGSQDYPSPSLSAKIKPHMVPILATTELVTTPVKDVSTGGLYFRDFMRAAATGLWSVNSLKDYLRNSHASVLVDRCNLLSDDAQRSSAILQFLRTCPVRVLSRRQARNVSEDPPLLFYILFEAAEQHGGEHLGILGSIITAEVLFGALSSPPRLTGRVTTKIKKRTASDKLAVFAGRPPDTMPALVEFVADSGSPISLSRHI